MGQAWCKEKTTKSQDSKSPLDRVFIRCAHRIYPGLKEECSVLGGATQRVTSSEIGYAGSPPRALLTRGCSIDSTDRPFHPSEWVDVNLEVPNTPRACPALTNLTIDTNLYPTTTTTSSCPNLMENMIPVPPPRKRKRNRGRPLPPKPDDVIENHRQIKSFSPNEEPLYSSVKTPKSKSTYFDSEESEIDLKGKSESSEDSAKMLKEVCEHKVNGTGKIIPSDVLSEGRSFVDNQNSQTSDDVRSRGKLHHEEEYERFSNSRSIQEALTPNHFNKDSKDSWKLLHNLEACEGSKNNSTVSLPNYNELQVTRDNNDNNSENEKFKVSYSERPLRKSITGSLPLEEIFSHSKIYDERFENIVWRADFKGIQVNKLENDEDKSKNLNRIHSEDDRVDFMDVRNQEKEEKSISKTNISPDSTGSLNSSETLKDSLLTEDIIKASTPIKTMNDISRSPGKLEISSSSDYAPALDSTASSQEKKNKNVGDDFFSDTSNLHSQVFYEAEETFPGEEGGIKQCSQGRKSDSDVGDSGKILKRSSSNDSFEEKELALDFQHSRIHRTISEESLPIEMLETVDSDIERADDDREDDFFEEKTAKDVQNRMTKNSAGTKEIKEILKTPPSSPEPKIKAEIFDNDHSTLLKVLQEEAAVAAGSNLSSMTPSLTELEVALSDMLEKKNEQEDHDDLFNQTDSLDQDDSLERKIKDSRSKSIESKSPEKLIEPCIVPVEKGRIFSDNTNNFNVKEGTKNVEISQDSELNGSVLEGTKSSRGKVKIVAVELKDGSVINNTDNGRSLEMKKEVLHDLSKNSIKSYDILRFAFDSKDSEVENSHGEETPEKPCRMNRLNLTDSIEKDGNIPTPPRRRHRSGSSSLLKENVCRATKNKRREGEDPYYANDRLI